MKKTISFEIIPPKNKSEIEHVKNYINKLILLKPDFISVTCHSSSDDENYSYLMSEYINNKNISSYLHITAKSIDNLAKLDVNIEKYMISKALIIRGDSYNNRKYNVIDILSHLSKNHNIELSVSGYPYSHIESKGLKEDIKYLSLKRDLGAKNIITQICFDSIIIEKYISDLADNYINLNLYVSILVISSRSSLLKVSNITNVPVPEDLINIFDKYENNKNILEKKLIEFNLNLIKELSNLKIQGFHIFTLNNYDLTHKLYKEIEKII